MKLISLNIECNRHDDVALSFLKRENADVVCIQEFLEDKFEFYKNELGLEGVFQVTNYADILIYKELAEKREGLAIFAKNIIESESMFYAGKEENALISFDKHLEYLHSDNFRANHTLLCASVQDDGKIFKFITTQLPVTIEGAVTSYQLEVIDNLLLKLDNLGEFVLCGDFNAPRGYESFSRFSEKYKDNIPAEYKTSIDQNLHRVKGIQFMVDSLFTTPTYKASNVKLVDGVSDHMAIVSDIIKI